MSHEYGSECYVVNIMDVRVYGNSLWSQYSYVPYQFFFQFQPLSFLPFKQRIYNETSIHHFIRGPEKEQWIRENNRLGSLYKMNKNCHRN
jgi:hypothetical protein